MPKGINNRRSLRTIAGLGVNRGLLPGPIELGCLGSSHDWEPLGEMINPRPGTIGVS